MNLLKEDRKWMVKAIRLAQRGIGNTSPNPRVGACVVKKGKLVGTGFHARAGQDHAEIIALKRAGRRAKGATLYVTLEPCAHFGKTPPCVRSVAESGIRRVVIGQLDPNPVTKRKGIRFLAREGMQVRHGVLKREAEALNRPFRKWVTRGIPYVTVKIAQSLDGKIATPEGDSKWISSAAARRFVQMLRKQADAILVGVGTVLRDDPRLAVRGKTSKPPAKVILDSSLRISPRARLFQTAGGVIIATTSRASSLKRKRLSRKADLILTPLRREKVDLRFLFRELARRSILHVLVEGGGEVMGQLIDERLADEAYFFVAPKIIGGRIAPTSVMGEGTPWVKNAKVLRGIELKRIGGDYLFHGYFR